VTGELAIRLGELSRGEQTWLLGWIRARNPRLVRNGILVMDALSHADRVPIKAIDLVAKTLDDDQ
jgi:hypothetical protein